jgi:hypothetical protein
VQAMLVLALLIPPALDHMRQRRARLRPYPQAAETAAPAPAVEVAV